MEWGVRSKHYYAERLSRTPAFQEFLSSNILEVTNEEYQSLSRQCIEYLQGEINEVAPSSHNSYVAWLSTWNKCFDHAAKTAGIVIKE